MARDHGDRAMRTESPARGVVTLVLFAAAALTFTQPTTAPAAQATLIPGQSLAGCPTAEIIGVHGTGEGPSGTNRTDSPEIKGTFRAFATDEQKLGEHSARLNYYSYPTISFAAYLP